MNVEHVAGKNKGKIMLYALSTCGWCKKTKDLLKKIDVAYDYVDVDEMQGEDLAKCTTDIKKYNPRGSHPTLVIDDGRIIIVGFKEDEIREAFKK